jgi:hypothetical protein
VNAPSVPVGSQMNPKSQRYRFADAPSSKIYFQWERKDAADNVITTPEEKYDYDDIRFDWKELRDENVQVRWYDGEFSFGEKTFQVARKALSRLELNTGQELEFPIIVLLYENIEDFTSWHFYVEEWVAGQTFSSQGVTAQIVPTGVQIEWINEFIPHEIAQIFSHQSIQKLIETFREGMDTRTAAEKAPGISWEEFEAEWTTWMGDPATPQPSHHPTQPQKPLTCSPPSYSTPTLELTSGDSTVITATSTSMKPVTLEENTTSENKASPHLYVGMVANIFFTFFILL